MQERVLVTGANGFIASHITKLLLEQGFAVRGTVRNPSNLEAVGFLKALPSAGNLELVSADLNDEGAFSSYTEDVDYVIHAASPFFIDVEDVERDLVRPAVRGTVSALEAAAKSTRVKRVILTSSMAAVTDAPDDRVLTEADWNEKSSAKRNPYYYSKTQAERAAWAFINRDNIGFDLVVINPFMVAGPSLSTGISTSNQLFIDIANGQYPALMALNWGFVDVRDVAQAHVRAMTAPNAKGRYICSAGNMDMHQITDIMRSAGVRGKLPFFDMSGQLGTAAMKLLSHFQPSGIGSYLRTHLGSVPHFENSKIRRDLGIEFRDVEETICDTVNDLIEWGHLSV
ncbi:aldehyde reductase [Sandarakinorhabdus sp.]|jgi:dihydroflavonol-4-reductase|uniref:SDR family oxidoreductase n=1 Tax=Sandarakinorhabdus sp. TaxID=1916663 RepID=UPI0028AB4105|nr:aldehyde reductase [Sandarakinorhabdus sp.]